MLNVNINPCSNGGEQTNIKVDQIHGQVNMTIQTNCYGKHAMELELYFDTPEAAVQLSNALLEHARAAQVYKEHNDE
jgi:hypothetical protein